MSTKYEHTMQRFEDIYVTPRVGRTLIVGSHLYGSREDRRLRYAEAVGVDVQAGPGVDVVADMESPSTVALLRPGFAHVECCSVLEHTKRPWLVAQTIEEVMVPGGTLLVSAPLVWRQHGYPSDYWRITAHALEVLFPRIEWINRALLSDKIRPIEQKVPALMFNNHVYLMRTEAVGFGVRVCE